jgi:hypothetical protein
MEIKKEDIEKGMFDNISKSLDLSTNPEKFWYTEFDINYRGSPYLMYIRNDGLKLAERNDFWNIVSPIDYTFENYIYRDKILKFLHALRDHLEFVEKKRKEQEKFKKLSEFFDLDIKKQRMKKLEKIENVNEDEN